MNPITPKYTITVQGREMPLHFEMFDMYAAAEKFGPDIDILKKDSDFWEKWSPFQQLPYMVCVGLSRAMPDVTPEWVMDNISWDNPEAFATVTAAIADFSRRLDRKKAEILAKLTPAETSSASSTDGPASGLPLDTTSDSAMKSSGT